VAKPKRVTASSVPLTEPSYNDRFAIKVGSGLTPQLISSVQRMADIGYMHQWADLLTEARAADPHMHGELAKREARVSGAPIEVRPVDQTRKAQKAADYCQELIDSLDVPPASLAVSFRSAVSHLLGATYHGRAGLETIWERDGRYLRPCRLHWIHPRRLSYAAHDWKLHVWDATVGDTRFALFPGVAVDDESVFPAGKLIIHTPRVFADYPTREGLGRCLIWYTAFKRWDVRDWLAFAAWAGRGLRVGKYASGKDPKNPAEASDEDVQVLKDALGAMSSEVATVISDATEFQLVPAPNNQEVHERLAQLCNNEMSKAISGGTLSADPGDRGARSLGEVQERNALAIAASDAGGISETIRRDLFAPAVRERFGDGYPVPICAVITEPRESLDSLVARVDKMAARGLRIPSGWVRDQLGIPEPTDDEETLGGAAPKSDEPDRDEESGEPDGDEPDAEEPGEADASESEADDGSDESEADDAE
jgi:phage gp29-like protein